MATEETRPLAGAPNPKKYVLRKAGILDLPFIYVLMVEGSRNGVFTDFYNTSQGQAALFKFLFRLGTYLHFQLYSGVDIAIGSSTFS